MKNKPLLFAVIGLVVLVLVGLTVATKNRGSNVSPAVDNTPAVELPINNLPLSERPFVTLTPDNSGRNLTLAVSGFTDRGLLEYELIYNATGKQEGVFGRIDLAGDKQSLAKTLLLGSKSAGGKVTYHEGITGGSLTLSTITFRLKESFNFLHFDPTDPSVSSSDVRFSATFPKTALKKNAVVVVMKTFGYPKEGLPAGVIVKAGPYALLTPVPVKGLTEVSLKLPAGDFVNPTIYAYQGGVWTALKTQLTEDTVTADSLSGNVFVVTAE